MLRWSDVETGAQLWWYLPSQESLRSDQKISSLWQNWSSGAPDGIFPPQCLRMDLNKKSGAKQKTIAGSKGIP